LGRESRARPPSPRFVRSLPRASTPTPHSCSRTLRFRRKMSGDSAAHAAIWRLCDQRMEDTPGHGDEPADAARQRSGTWASQRELQPQRLLDAGRSPHRRAAAGCRPVPRCSTHCRRTRLRRVAAFPTVRAPRPDRRRLEQRQTSSSAGCNQELGEGASGMRSVTSTGLQRPGGTQHQLSTTGSRSFRRRVPANAPRSSRGFCSSATPGP
jgi:hypothetical protein